MHGFRFGSFFFAFLLSVAPLLGQVHHHSRYPNAPSNDPQLLLPSDEAQFCYTPDSERSGYDEFEQFDTYPQPASRGYLCINVPAGKTFVIDHLFAEADYDQATPVSPEWYLDSVTGRNETQIGFAPAHAGSLTQNSHYLLSEQVHLAVNGGSRVTLIMHDFYVSASSRVVETPGTASLLLAGHWE
jgi:hypothetical protein